MCEILMTYHHLRVLNPRLDLLKLVLTGDRLPILLHLVYISLLRL